MTSYTSTTPAQLEDLRASGAVYLSHTAKRQGYVSRKSEGQVLEYRGKFGHGFILDTPRFDSTRFHNRSYFIKA
jgi:hypothetical protein